MSAGDRVDQPAFPVFPEGATGHASAFRGMSLRDWFAGQALVGLCMDIMPERVVDGRTEAAIQAERAYAIADEMLRAREDT